MRIIVVCSALCWTVPARCPLALIIAAYVDPTKQKGVLWFDGLIFKNYWDLLLRQMKRNHFRDFIMYLSISYSRIYSHVNFHHKIY